MNKIKFFIYSVLAQPHIISLIKSLTALMVMLWVDQSMASGNDILVGAESEALATVKGSGKKIMYITELVMAVAAYIKAKNLLALAGIGVIAIFINVVTKMAA